MNTSVKTGKTATMPSLREKSIPPLSRQSSSSTSPSPSSNEFTPSTAKATANNSPKENCSAQKKTKSRPKPKPKWLTFLTSRLEWVPANWTFAKWKPVIRCALVAWISLVLFVIPAVEREMGQASILILTVAFLSPPSDPFLMMLEREILIIFFVCLAWAWASLGIFLANLSRNYRDPNVTFLEAATGRYIEAAPSIIMAVFAFLGSATFLFIRARKGPGPYFVPTVLACICLDISFTTACIFPYPFYDSGRGVVLPLALHTAICIVVSLIVFPSTVSTLFTTRLVAVLTPLEGMLDKNIELLAVGPYDDMSATLRRSAEQGDDENSPEHDHSRPNNKESGGAANEKETPDSQATNSSPVAPYASTLASARALTRAAESALAHLAAVGRLLHSDLIYSRFAPSDFDAFHKLCRRLAGRADGLGIYFGLVEAGLSTHAGVNPDSRPMTSVDTISVVGEGGGIGSGGGGMIAGAERGQGHKFTPRRVDSLPATLHAREMSRATGTRSPAQPHHRHGRASNNAHAQLHFATLNHSQSLPGLRPETEIRIRVASVHAGGRSGTATPNMAGTGPPHLKQNHTHAASQSHSESDTTAYSHRAHALHLHHAMLPLTRGLSHVPGLKHEHGGNHEDVPRLSSKKAEWAVGTFESQRYMNLEATRLHDPRADEWTRLTFGLLRESCTPFLGLCALGINTTKRWLTDDVQSGRLKHFFGIKRAEEQKRKEERRKEIEEVRDKLQEGLRVFKEEERHLVLGPYLRAFERSVVPPPAVTPHASPLSTPLRSDESLPRMSMADRGAPSLSGNRNRDNMGETTPNKDVVYLMDDIVAATHDGIFPETRMRESSPCSVANHFANPNLENAGKDGADDYKHSEGSGTHERTNSPGAQEPSTPGLKDSPEMPPHRYLFHCYVYQYNLIQMGRIVIQMLDEILRLEAERPEPKLWTPVAHLFTWTPWCVADSPNAEQIIDEDDDPDVIQGFYQKELDQATGIGPGAAGINTTTAYSKTNSATWYEPELESTNLGLPRQRDPDSLPPRNAFEWFFNQISSESVFLGNASGVGAHLHCEISNIFCSFMGQLSLSRFRGDTTFILVARITSTFFGGVAGMVMWYISTGSGNGSPYGLAATCFVCFPFFFFARLYWPVPQLMNIVFFVTAVLVVGFSYQDQHVVNPGSPGTGYQKRTLLVSAGVFAAFIASFLPPATTIRRYERTLLATTSAEMGTIYCAILSFANTKHKEEIQDIIVSLLALRSKLTRSYSLRTNVGYEFSLRGRWPSERYQAVADLQMALAYSLSHLVSVLEHLEPSWSRAFLRRTRFMDPGFQGDILAVVSMISNSLRTGTPLPQITPCPLLDRFTYKYHGLDVIHKDSEEDYGLPRNLSMDTLENEQYL
ncbi:hypothetical protein D9619_003562 [Psilocybe cf. subviscida]|uniref:ER transporter 6TM N-terminal domain-containing protein n=1 Tax=Psilocybe cf. subviscida TaxID=2480587 RepID=A0A8H5EU23_9AGAR|nr:hypothetical protein D9619_003562 [Psilocybe cf. subviscida]